MLITLSGIDGSGKSTQIQRLEDTLRSDGLRTYRFWLRPGYSQELDALRALVRRVAARSLPTADEREAREAAFQKPGVNHAWVFMALLDLLFQYGLKLRALLQRYDVVICDRYLIDAELDFILRFPELRAQMNTALRLFHFGLPNPDLSLLLMIPFDEMESRLALKNEPFPEPPEGRRIRWQHYARLVDTPEFTTINAAEDIESVHSSIMNHVDPIRLSGGR